jgi:hypothetical protein
MTKKCIRFLLGLNGASVVRGLRLGFSEFVNGCFASLGAAHPLQDQINHKQWKELKSHASHRIFEKSAGTICLALPHGRDE